MNVKVFTAKDAGCEELGTLIGNMLRPIDADNIDDGTNSFILQVTPTAYYGPKAELGHGLRLLATFSVHAPKMEMQVNYISRVKMGRLGFNYADVRLAAPGTIERVQDMIRKTIKVYSKWLSNRSEQFKKSQISPKQKTKQRFAHRPR